MEEIRNRAQNSGSRSNPDPGRDVTAAHEIPAMTLSFLLPVVP
jgi:hypothetical protein